MCSDDDATAVAAVAFVRSCARARELARRKHIYFLLHPRAYCRHTHSRREEQLACNRRTGGWACCTHTQTHRHTLILLSLLQQRRSRVINVDDKYFWNKYTHTHTRAYTHACACAIVDTHAAPLAASLCTSACRRRAPVRVRCMEMCVCMCIAK